MLNTQKQFATYLKKLDSLLEGQSISYDSTLLPKVMETELVIPVIGAFSAGKSTLLNKLMGDEILPVGIAPETELATELRYSEESYLLALRPDGSAERVPVSELSSINKRSSEFSHLRLYINSEPLKAIAPLVLVDMPGFGSSLENHNKAIAYYLPRGVHFVILTSIEEGNITDSMLRKLDELKNYNTDFTFLLSKCDLRAADQVKEVKDYINDQLEVYFGEGYRSITLENKNGQELQRELLAIQPEMLFSRLFLDALKAQNFEIMEQINLALSMLKKDKAEGEQTLLTLERALHNLQQQRQDAESELKGSHADRVIQRALKNLDTALNDSLEELVNLCGTKSPNVLSNTLSDIIRSSLSRTLKAEMQSVSDAMVNQIANNLSSANSQMATLNISKKWSEELSEKVKITLENTTEKLDDWTTRLNEEAKKTSDNKNIVAYRSITTVLAVTTSVVIPLIELAIIFLPDIIKMLSGDRYEREKFRQKLLSEIFPSIKAELRSEIPPIIDQQLDLLIDKIAKTFEEQIEKQQKIVDSVIQENLQLEADINNKTAQLEELAIKLKSAASEHLYSK